MKIALVTGASSGLGREYVLEISRAEPGIDEIWAVARRADRLEELKAVSRIPVRPVPADLTREEDIERIEALLEKTKPEIRLLIHAAGFGKIGTLSQIDRKTCDRMIDLNCRAAVDVTYLALPYMKEGSRIVEVCSTAAFQPFPFLNVYAASKAFLYRFTRALRREVMHRGIGVTAVCPYWIRDTEFIPTARDTEGGGAAIRHFPLSQSVRAVARYSLFDSRCGFAVSTPGIMCSLHRIAAKFIPADAMMGIWELIRKL